MTREEIYKMLESTGYPVAYLQFPEDAVPPLPFVTYYFPYSDNFGADNSVYQQIEKLNVLLYTKNKDFVAEGTVEAVLGAASHYWDKSETYIFSEHSYQVLYETEVIITNGEQD